MMVDLKNHIRSVPDFPEKGIMFRDITTLLKDGAAWREAVMELIEPYMTEQIDQVVAMEARGFIIGGVVACELGCGFVPVRKSGKLPAETIEKTYELEYGTDTLAMHRDAINPGDRVLMVDDLLATGGTMAASCEMVEELGGEIVSCAFLIELEFLGGREKLAGYDVFSLASYASESEV
jgi:adenine phosphoribosyltransferase